VLPDVRAQRQVNFDASAIKTIEIKERSRLQVRAEFFNLFNHPYFNSPGTTFGNASFGIISGATDGRTIQFGLKVIY